MKKVFGIVVLIAAVVAGNSFGQKGTTLIRQGNKKYEKGEFPAAEKDYRKALETDKGSVKGAFNLGAAVYQEKNFKESANIYGQLSGQKLDPATMAKVYHNLGNSYLEAKEYDKSIQAYKNALINNPKDLDTKYNLEYAKMMLKKQQQQQQQNKDQQKDKKDQQQQQPQQNQDQANQPPDQKKISKDEANRMLEAMKNDEKKTLEKVNKKKGKPMQVGVVKDW